MQELTALTNKEFKQHFNGVSFLLQISQILICVEFYIQTCGDVYCIHFYYLNIKHILTESLYIQQPVSWIIYQCIGIYLQLKYNWNCTFIKLTTLGNQPPIPCNLFSGPCAFIFLNIFLHNYHCKTWSSFQFSQWLLFLVSVISEVLCLTRNS